MNLQKAEQLVNELMNKTFEFDHYKYSELSAKSIGYTFEWHNRKTSLGTCNYRNKKIYLSKCLTEKQPEERVKNTILHEIAHAFNKTIYNSRGHGHTWKKLHKEMGGTAERVARLTKDEMLTDTKYTAKCGTCENAVPFHRRPKLSRSCGVCSPNKYNEKFKLEIIQNW